MLLSIYLPLPPPLTSRTLQELLTPSPQITMLGGDLLTRRSLLLLVFVTGAISIASKVVRARKALRQIQ